MTEPTDRPARARVTLTDISSRAWEHPADRGALTAVRQLKGFDFLVKKLFSLVSERALRLQTLGSAVRVDSRQFPTVHRLYAEAGATLDVRDLPELYVDNNPIWNAMAIGMDKPFIVIHSSLVKNLDEDELRFVLAHELGHVQSGHALYHSVLIWVLNLSRSLGWVPIGAIGLRVIAAALKEWSRKAELSADRAGLLGCQDPAAALRGHMRMASGGQLEELDTAAFLEQGREYDEGGDMRDSILKLLMLEQQTHPMSVHRAAELRRWVDDGEYNTILGGNYPRRQDDANASMSEEARAAAKSYQESFERSQDPLMKFAKDASSTVGEATDWVTSKFRGNRRNDD